MKTLNIKLRRRHIMKGECRSTSKCAGALAICELLPEQYVARVMDSNVLVYEKDANGIAIYPPVTNIKLPRSMQRFIARFDKATTATAKRQLEPFTFQLKLPEGLVK
jgi:hypothetical protein